MIPSTNGVPIKKTEIIYLRANDTPYIPFKATPGSAGFDIQSPIDVKFSRKGVHYINTGIALEIPDGNVGLLIERSSLHKKGMRLANTLGVIDSDYRGDIILAVDVLHDDVEIKAGDRLAQLIVLTTSNVVLAVADKLSETRRGDGGFGSTGV